MPNKNIQKKNWTVLIKMSFLVFHTLKTDFIVSYNSSFPMQPHVLVVFIKINALFEFRV